MSTIKISEVAMFAGSGPYEVWIARFIAVPAVALSLPLTMK